MPDVQALMLKHLIEALHLSVSLLEMCERPEKVSDEAWTLLRDHLKDTLWKADKLRGVLDA